MFSVTIDDYSWEPIALTPDNAAKPWIDMSSRAVFGRLCNPSLKEIKVKILFSPRETPRYNLRFRIVDRAADNMILAIPNQTHPALRCPSTHLQTFPVQ